MKTGTRRVLVAMAIVLIAGGVGMVGARIKITSDVHKVTLPSLDDVPAECWAILAEKKVFFGHHSVGYNIIDGIGDIMRERDCVKLNIVETFDPADFDQPVFAHLPVGRNTDPLSKINSFREIMDSGVGEKADIVFFKLCYVDVMRDSDVQQIFGSYKTAIEQLQGRYPRAKFLHITVPIRSTPKGIGRNLKHSIKSLIGKSGVLDDNIIRQRYNKLLCDTYSGTEPVFDLALAESIDPSGLRCYATKGEKVYVMISEYTDDGGHLNSDGRRKVAEQLLVILAEMAGNS
ncbi:MAG: hypothetical protein ABIF19_15470 [Planctomycetota bacterium]